MKIVYIHQYFKTPREPGSTRSYYVILDLIKAGHSVTVIGAKKEGQQKLVERYEIDGINVISISNYYSGKLEIKERAKSFFRFMIIAIFELFKLKKVDFVIATSTPLTVGVPALLYKKLRGIPYLFEVRDLIPEVPIQMGALKNPIIRKSALILERQIYKNAWHIVALSPGMAEEVIKVSERYDNVSMIPNMAKIDNFWRRDKNDSWRIKLGLKKESFKLIYFGAMGLANGLDYILDAAILLKEKCIEDVEFILLGDGSMTERLKQRVKVQNLNNVKFYGRVPMNETSEIVNLCDGSIVSFLNIPILYTNSPNKLFDSLSAGVPIIVNSNGWTKKLVEDNDCGAYVDPDKPEELVEIIQKWKGDRFLLQRISENARKLAETQYDKLILCQKFTEIINSFNQK